jgi:ABC transport system ATP-binding/permease protein
MRPGSTHFIDTMSRTASPAPTFDGLGNAARVRAQSAAELSVTAMAPLVRFDSLSVTLGEQRILVGAELAIEPGERVCLIGRNGAGKSTTLKLIAGVEEPDDGTIERAGDLRLAMLDQRLAAESAHTVREFVALGMAEQLRRIAAYHALSRSPSPDAGILRELEALQRAIDAGGGWSIDVQVNTVISDLDLPAEQRMDELSGGWRRRVTLARALVSKPDLLLLDEPTNHLDIGTIEWLEERVRTYPGAVVFVTHDRSFVERAATRIVDIDRGRLRSWPGGYLDYLTRKAESDQQEDLRNALFDKKLAEEEAWIRQGVKARRTRNEGRVRALEELRDIRAQRLKRARSARILISESAELSGRKVIEARNVTHGFGGKPLLTDFSLRVMRGDRVGIIGNNGVGKTTLLRILLGELPPDSGTVSLGTHLEVGYFDQLRRDLDPSKTVAEIIGEGRDYVTVQGRKKHVVAYLTDFLFTAKRAMTPIAALSGGERNRVILAKLFTRSANLLVLDEPTNDLDVETLEALEARLADYEGTLIVCSHDRYFLDATVTSTLVFEEDGLVRRHAGGYTDWLERHRKLAVVDAPVAHAAEEPRFHQTKPAARKLSYKLKRELDALPDAIEGLEARGRKLRTTVNDPAFYQRSHTEVHRQLDELRQLETELEAAMERWGELENLAASVASRPPDES